jgi:gluconokinase
MKKGQVILLMGVSGCGKSTLGEKLAEKTGGYFIEGDKLHPESNIQRMSSGQPLRDEDRWPWFDRISAAVVAQKPQEDIVFVTCSALKEKYRQYLCQAFGDDWKVIHLKGSFEIIHQRMLAREHFMPASLLQSQFETLEDPTYGSDRLLTLLVEQSKEEMLKEAMQWLGMGSKMVV